MRRVFFVAVALIMLSLVAVLPAGGQDAAVEEMSAEQAAMMKAWMDAGTPGDAHEHLAESVGTWDVTVSFWMEPDGDPEVSEGRAVREMILGGRVLRESFRGTAMGMPFEGFGLTGYDNNTNEYWATWNDSMMTALMTSRGHCSEDGIACTYIASAYDPMTQQSKFSKTLSTKKGKDREVMESWAIGADGKETLEMRLIYDRVKE